MKKFLSVVSLLLIAMMIIAMPTVSAEETSKFTIPEGVGVYYATDVSASAPSIDGTIDEGEYGKVAIKVDDPKATKNSDWGSSWEDEAVDNTLASDFMEFYFAYDNDSVYIAIYEECQPPVEDGDEFAENNLVFRNNYSFQFGFDPADVTSYFSFGGFATNNQWANLVYYDAGSKADHALKTYDLISECIVKKTDVSTGSDVSFGDLISANGNVNYTGGKWSVTMEFKLDKKTVADALNQIAFTNYDTISDAMWISVGANAYRAKANSLGENVTQYWKWLGQNDIREKQSDFIDYGLPEGSKRQSMFDLVVFAPEGAEVKLADPEALLKETEAPTTEVPTEEPTTEEPATEILVSSDDVVATDAPTTEPPVTEPASNGGCGGSVSLAGIALVATLGACTVFVAKKKEN